MINSRDIAMLDPEAREACDSQVRLCRDIGIELLVTSTYRDAESQDSLYAIGRTAQQNRHAVTNARGGESWHNYKCAWDVVPLVGGKCVWEDPQLWKRVIECGKAAGANSIGAEWKSFPDRPHFGLIPKMADGSAISLAEAKRRWAERGTVFA